MPGKSGNVKNEKQYEALKDEGTSALRLRRKPPVAKGGKATARKS